MKLHGTEIIEKKNVLNQIHKNSMTLQELRFFSIYLAKINARDTSTRRVRFKLDDFQKIMNLGRMNIQNFEDATNRLLCKIVRIPNEDGTDGYTKFQLFKECKVFKDKNNYNQWYVEIDAHDKALPLMFNFKKNYFTYELWNALRLKSRNQLHMYELLKQYESIGIREIKLEQLKDWLGIGANEYPRWAIFRIDVLNVCQEALKTYTDIQFEYEAMKTGRRITGVRFIISKNKNYKDPLKLAEFINELGANEEVKELIGKEISEIQEIDGHLKVVDQQKEYRIPTYQNEWVDYLAGACNNEFSEEEMIVIKDLLFDLGYCQEKNRLETYEYLQDKYHELNTKKQIPKNAINRRFGYIKWLLRDDLENDKLYGRKMMEVLRKW